MKTFALLQAFLSLIAPNDYAMQDDIMQKLQESTNYTFYEYTTYMPNLEEIQKLEENTYGTGERTEKIKKYIYPGVTHFFDSSIYSREIKQKIVGVIPFYGPYDKIIAYEYIVACGDNVCGSLYSVFPGIDNEEEAIKMLNKDFKCNKDSQNCLGIYDHEMYSIKEFAIPDITPASYRISKLGNYSGKIKFYHGIYGLDSENNKIYSLDRDDRDLIKDDIIKRLKELANPDNYSFTLDLLKKKAKKRGGIVLLEKKSVPDVDCDGCDFTTYTNQEIIDNRKTEKSFENLGEYKKIYLPSILTGSYNIVSRENKEGDYLTGRILMYRMFGVLTSNHYKFPL